MLSDDFPGAPAVTVEVVLGGEGAVMDVLLGVITEVLDRGEVGQGHVGGARTGLLGHIEHAVTVREVVSVTGALAPCPHILLIPVQPAVGAEVVGQHLPFTRGSENCLGRKYS